MLRFPIYRSALKRASCHVGVAIALIAATTGCSPDRPESPEAANEAQAAAEIAANAGNALESAPLPPVPVDPDAGEAGGDAWTWTHFRSAGGAGFPVLIYGARGNDEIVVNLQCRETGKVTLLQLRDALGEGRGEPITLEADGRRVAFESTLGPDSGDGHTPATAPVELDHPILSSFRRTARLSVGVDGQIRSVNAIDGTEKAAIKRFFAACSP